MIPYWPPLQRPMVRAAQGWGGGKGMGAGGKGVGGRRGQRLGRDIKWVGLSTGKKKKKAKKKNKKKKKRRKKQQQKKIHNNRNSRNNTYNKSPDIYIYM